MRSRYRAPIAQFIMCRMISVVRLIDAGESVRGFFRLPAIFLFPQIRDEILDSAVLISASGRWPK